MISVSHSLKSGIWAELIQFGCLGYPENMSKNSYRFAYPKLALIYVYILITIN